MKVLFVGAHTDDIELSCGGTLARMIEEGYETRCFVLSDCQKLELERECCASFKTLGVDSGGIANTKVREFSLYRQTVLDVLIRERDTFQPDKVFTHSSNDRHQDHQVVGDESLRAFRDLSLFTYTSPINRLQGVENYHVKLSEIHIEAKLLALSMYKSQSYRAYMQPDIVISNARICGLKGGCEYAESFEIIKYVRN